VLPDSPRRAAISRREIPSTANVRTRAHSIARRVRWRALLLRGAATVTDVDGFVPEYVATLQRYLGEEGAAGFLGHFDEGATKMHRIAVRPDWVGALDFKTRLPGVMGGIQG